ncbi:hypothetical protein LMH87_010501 [Akanthomyces muscarius]|uniref:Uncharacterized protein n=1 Tax=Akanthomyces muscarius TaxID=2231603 RepID=A0A9W8QE54_AKAMU|nr:hypothetical protein LMH87_010501 [Akanthomyces muscarius]KAJ4154037.1 hypothetical protein LMH87_010501 [Akanthomyces muscarius]
MPHAGYLCVLRGILHHPMFARFWALQLEQDTQLTRRATEDQRREAAAAAALVAAKAEQQHSGGPVHGGTVDARDCRRGVPHAQLQERVQSAEASADGDHIPGSAREQQLRVFEAGAGTGRGSRRRCFFDLFEDLERSQDGPFNGMRPDGVAVSGEGY